jgi:hypothetical protein
MGPVPVELLETRAVDVLEALVAGDAETVATYFEEPHRSRFLDVWQRTVGIYGEFGGVTGINADPDQVKSSGDRAVEVHFELGTTPFKTHTEFSQYGEVTGFWILKGEDTNVLDLVSDTGRVLHQEAISKVSAVLSMLSRTDQPGSGDDLGAGPVDEGTRRRVEALVTDLERGRFQQVYDRLAPELRDDTTPARLESAWERTVTEFRGIQAIAEKDGTVEAVIDDADGTSIVTVSFGENDAVRGLRIDTPRG